MPLADKKKYNEYMNTYMKRRYFRRREEAIARLGGCCITCGSNEELHFDHIVPIHKSFPVAKAFSGWSQKRLDEELRKCQLLCVDCHKEKHAG